MPPTNNFIINNLYTNKNDESLLFLILTDEAKDLWFKSALS